jgi:hypothetical protein
VVRDTKNSLVQNVELKNNSTQYQTHSSSLHPRVTPHFTKSPLVPRTLSDSHTTQAQLQAQAINAPTLSNQAYNGQDWSKKLNSLINAYDGYRHNFNDLLGISPTLLRAVEGLYSDYGQYENVPNSGWSHYTPISLSQQNALSIPDKIAFGTKIYNMLPVSILNDEKGAEELSKLHDQDGGNKHNNFDRYTQKFNKALLTQLKKYVDLEGLETKNDDISRLAYTRLKSYFDIMDIIIDNEKLQEFTGISLDTNKEKDLFITKRLLPDPLDAIEQGKPLSLWAEDEKKVAEELKASKNFEFIKPFLLDSPVTLISDPNSLYNQSEASFFNPYESLSNTAKNMLNIRRDQIQDYTTTLPHNQANKIREIFSDPKILGKYAPPTATDDPISATKGVLPATYQSVSSDFFKKQREKLIIPANKFKEQSNEILDSMNAISKF